MQKITCLISLNLMHLRPMFDLLHVKPERRQKCNDDDFLIEFEGLYA